MSYRSPVATTTTAGNVIVGPNLSITDLGVLSADISTGPTGPTGATGSTGPIATGPTGVVFPAAAAYFYNSTSQPNTVINTANPVVFDTTVFANNITLASSSQVTVNSTGVYSFIFTVSLTKTSGGPTEVSLWLAQNGANITESRQDVAVANTNDTLFASGNYVIQLSAGDYLQMFWSSASAITSLLASPAAVTPTRPAIPSARITIAQIS